jgi:hypothetical protein
MVTELLEDKAAEFLEDIREELLGERVGTCHKPFLASVIL